MPLIYRILMRLAVAWVVLVGGLMMAVAVANGTLGAAAWGLVAIVVGVPAVLLCAIAWVIRPPLDRASLRRLWRE
jgi:hypothetical protein